MSITQRLLMIMMRQDMQTGSENYG